MPLEHLLARVLQSKALDLWIEGFACLSGRIEQTLPKSAKSILRRNVIGAGALCIKSKKLTLIKIQPEFAGPLFPEFSGEDLHVFRVVKFVNNFQPKKCFENIFKGQDT